MALNNRRNANAPAASTDPSEEELAAAQGVQGEDLDPDAEDARVNDNDVPADATHFTLQHMVPGLWENSDTHDGNGRIGDVATREEIEKHPGALRRFFFLGAIRESTPDEVRAWRRDPLRLGRSNPGTTANPVRQAATTTGNNLAATTMQADPNAGLNVTPGVPSTAVAGGSATGDSGAAGNGGTAPAPNLSAPASAEARQNLAAALTPAIGVANAGKLFDAGYDNPGAVYDLTRDDAKMKELGLQDVEIVKLKGVAAKWAPASAS